MRLSTPTRTLLKIASLFAMAVLTLVVVDPAEAQPDIREIRPVVMLLVDSSGSMERVGDCVCTTPACQECMPDCSSTTPSRNRWANVIETLTGTWENYSCVQDARRRGISAAGFSYVGARDEGAPNPHTIHLSTGQANNGVLDTYVDRVKFGLMTFDGVPTWVPENALVREAAWSETLSRGTAGDYSYGESRRFRYAGCTDTEYRVVNNGSRSELAPAGALVSVGSDADDHQAINADIQANLLGQDLRPSGSTPVAGMLDDLTYYFANDEDVRPVTGGVGDPYAQCRARYAILLTDGPPSADFRGYPYYCESAGQGTAADPFHEACPYPEPTTSAATLTEASGPLDGLYVVGLNVPAGDTAARGSLNAIAAAGQTCPTGTTTECARFPADASELRNDFEEIMRQANPGTTTRTVPAFSGGALTGGAQLQFQTGFNPTFSAAALGYEPWGGVLERRRYECDGTNPVAQPINNTDRFHELLNSQSSRRLLTVTPSDATAVNAHLVGTERTDADQVPDPVHAGRIDLSTGLADFNPTNVSPQHLGVAGGARRDEVVDWVWGAPGTERATRRMGSIYHSSPVIVGPPGADRSDETFNEYRQLPSVANRPRVLYVGTNDGILHAFAADDYERASDGVDVVGGTELWGFIPPILLDELESTMDSHQWMLDGSPVVQEVVAERTGPGSANDWRTVLVMGFRQGANGFFALDVTDPEEPVFLWQFAHSALGQTYGQPRLAQVNVDLGRGVHQRTVAILPGGYSAPTGATQSITDPRHIPATVSGVTARTTRREFSGEGQSLFVVDLLTGRILTAHTDFPAPVTGGVSVFPGSVGSDAQAAYFNDHDGVLYRLDLSSTDPDDWDYQAIWDQSHSLGARGGQPAYNPPILSTREDGRVVIIQATGDIDNLEDTDAVNRVVSLTESITVNTATLEFSGVSMELNWELRGNPNISLANGMPAGEQITGPMELFNGVLYFGSFRTAVDPSNACSFGYSRLWGIDYVEHVGTNLNRPLGRLENSSGATVRSLGPSDIPALDNSLLVGVGVAARPRCSILAADPTETDPYLNSTRASNHVTSSAPAQFELIAQVSGQGVGADGAAVATVSLELETPEASVSSLGTARRVE